MGTEKKIGIGVLKKDLVVFAKLTAAVDKALEDKKISIGEGIAISFKAIDLVKVVKTFKTAIAEIKDLDAKEIKELEAEFIAKFDLRNDEAEKMVETFVKLAIQMVVAMELAPVGTD